METEAMLTPAQVAALFGVHPKTVARWGREGKLGRVMRAHSTAQRRYYEADVRKVLAGRGGES